MLTPSQLNTLAAQFPLLNRKIRGKRVVYLDNAATTLKPNSVIDAISNYYRSCSATAQRSNHYLAHQTEKAIEEVRTQVQKWIKASFREEIIFTSGTTASLNLIARCYGGSQLKAGDEVLITAMEHHSNWLPWQRLCEEKGARLRTIPLLPDYQLDLEAYAGLLNQRTKIVALTYVSNVLGIENPIQRVTAQAHGVGAKVVVDAAQAAAHLPLDVEALDCDFLAFSAHKVYGPTGVGVLYGKRALLEAMAPDSMGGGMVERVIPDIKYGALPHRFEAGTPNSAGIVGFGAALTFLEEQNTIALARHEAGLLAYAKKRLATIAGCTILCATLPQMAICSFSLEGHHPFDVGLQLDFAGISLRTGDHCASPLMKILGINGVIRLSLACYNRLEDIDELITSLNNL